MKIIGVQSRVSPFLIAVVLLLQVSPAIATGQPGAQQATSQEPVEVTFTKWVTGPVLRPRQLWNHGRAGSHGRVHRR